MGKNYFPSSERSIYGQYFDINRNTKIDTQVLKLLICLLLFLFASNVFAANFSQSNWSSGIPANASACTTAGGSWIGSECVASDPSDQSGWTAYSSKEVNMDASSSLSLGVSATSVSHSSPTDFALNADVTRTQAGLTDFSAGTTSNTTASSAVSLAIAAASTAPVWSTKTSWNSVDVGNANTPVYVDLDGDGDLDTLIGSQWGYIYGFKNTGTSSAPVWEASNVVEWSPPDVGSYVAVGAADLDNDGDIDLMIGESVGFTYGYENTGTSSAPVWTANPAWDIGDIGGYSQPVLVDLDGDGDHDILLGSSIGVSYAYENTGSAMAPVWTARPAWNTPDIGSYAAPAAGDIDSDGDFDLMIGEYTGFVRAYENTGSSSSPVWVAKPSWDSIDVGRQTAPAIADVDNDGDLDILIGEYYGFALAYENTGSQYFSAGNFVSSVIDTGSHSGLNSIEFSATIPASTTLNMDVRSGNTATPDGSWTAWQTGLGNGGDISGQGNNRYVQYRANFSTSDTSLTPSLASVTITFLNFPFASSAQIDNGNIKLNIVSATPAWTYNSAWNAPDFGVTALPRLVDMDDDGDHDLMVGDNYGYVFGVENTGSDIAPTWVAQPAWNTPTDAGSNVKPGFADLDNDGDFDMLLGDSTGNVNGYENTGSKTAPTWLAKPAWNMGDQGSTGVAPVLHDLDGDGDFDVLLGTFNGISYGFENTGSVTAPTWANKASWNTPDVGSYSVPAFADLDGDGDSDLLVGSGAGTTYGYENTGNSTNPVWTARSSWNIADIGSNSAPTLAQFESDSDYDLILGTSTGANRGYKNTGTVVFEATGQYISSIIDLGPHAGFTTLGYTSNVPVGTSITVDLRSGNTSLPDGSWSAWQTGISNGGSISALPSDRYVQYRITLSATDTSVTPSLSSITINYSQYVTTATLTSSAYDSGQVGTILNNVSWIIMQPANTGVQIQIRSAADNTGTPSTWSAWVGPDGTSNSFWDLSNTHAGGCSGGPIVNCSNIPAQFRSTFGSQWFQYKATLTSSGVYTPVLTNISVEYDIASNSGSGGITVSAISGATSEAGATAYFTVALDNAPTANATLGLFSNDLSEGTVSPATLTFTPTDWNTPKTVTVYGVDDLIDDGDINFSIITGAVSSTDVNYTNLNPADVSVSNIDNDSSSFTITPSSGLLTDETGLSAAFSVVLTSQPSANVTIALSSSDTTEGTVTPTSLTFTPSNWAVLQSVTVTGVNDAIIDFGVPYSIVTAAAVSSDSNYSGVNPVDVSITNEDDDTPNIIVTASDGFVTNESGGFVPISISLDKAPTSNVSFTLSSSDTTEGLIYMFFPLTFTPSNWNISQSVTVYGANDGEIDGDQSYSIITSSFTSADLDFHTANPSDIYMINVDNDSYSVTVTPTTGLVTTEAGGAASFIIRLGSQPTSDVTINMSSSDPGEGIPAQSSITFTPSDPSWRGKKVTITGIDDRDSDGNQLYTIVLDLVSSDPNFNSINPSDVTVTNVDDNGSSPLQMENNIMSSQFGGSVATADVNCDSIPDLLVGTIGQFTYDEVYVYHGSATGYDTSSPDWIGRDLNSNTNFGQRVFSVGDINKDGCDDIMIGATKAQTYFPTVSRLGAIYLFNGSASGLPDADSDGIGRVSDASWQAIGEQAYGYLGDAVTAGDFNGDSYIDIAVTADSYTNALPYEGKIYVFLNSANGLPDADSDGVALMNEASWTFESDTSSAYAGRKQGLAAADINGDGKSDLMIAVSAYSNGQSKEGGIFAFYGSASGFNDADSDGIARLSDADWVFESDSINAYTDAVANAGDVNGDGVDDIIIGAYRFETSSSTFDEGKAYIFHGSNPSGLPDADSDGIAHPSDANWQVESNDYNARLGTWVSSAGDYNNDGYGDVIVGAPRYSPDLARVGGAFIYPGSVSGVSITPIWTQQGVAADDFFGTVVGVIGDVDGDGYSDIFVGTPGNGTGTPDTPNEGAVFVYLSNKQFPGFSITPPGSLTTTESGGQTTFSVVLEAPPVADVTIAVNSNNSSEGTASPTSLTFTQTNWMTPQTVTVTGVNDAIADGNAPYLIILGAAVSTDSGYSGLDPSDVAISNIDNNVPQEVNVTAMGGSESETGNIIFTRTGEITTTMTVNYNIAGTAVAGQDYNPLSGVTTIPIGSASVTIPVRFLNDRINETNETITVDVALGPDYAIGTSANATLIINDDDSPGFNIWPSVGLVTSETGDSDSFMIKLISRPAANVTINFSSSDTSEALVIPASITFTPSNWNNDQTVTVIGQNDASTDGNIPFTISTAATSIDSDYNGLSIIDVTGTNRDDDSLPTVSLSTSDISVNEGDKGSNIFTISRSSPITNKLRVFYSVTGTASSGLDYIALTGVETIPAGSSSVSISIETIQDNLVEGDETVALTLAGGTEYLVVQPSSNSITLVDDDDQATLPLANFILDQTVGEGRTVTVMAILNKAPLSYPVTIPYTLSGTATNPADHDATNGNLVITTGTNASMTFNAINDGAGETDETLIFTMGTPINANIGSRNQHIVTITEGNEPAKVIMTSQQSGTDARLVVISSGNVTVTANVDDPNPSDSHTYDWSMSNNNLVDINDGNPATFRFNPSGLSAGFYKVRLTVTDSATPSASTSVELLLDVISSAPILTAADTDNDGIADNAESFDDSDGDGIADYLDSSTLDAHELQLTLADNNSYIMRTELGLNLGLGDVAFAANADGAYVTTSDIAAYGAGEGNAGVASAQDSVASPSGYFDFVVSALPEAGQSVKIVIPQFAAIPTSPSYRKYDPQTGWRDFVIDSNNSLASTPGAPGICPPPGDTSYVNGLHEGDYCIQLMIQDGGPNDTDGQINNIVEDPGSIILGSPVDANSFVTPAQPNTTEELINTPSDTVGLIIPAQPDTLISDSEASRRYNMSSSSGGGNLAYLSLMFLLLLCLHRIYKVQQH